MSGPDLAAPWHGVERSKIDWAPHIEDELCIGCGLCATSCGRKVFDFDFERKQAVVARPIQCMVGCVTCENLCPQKAIGFPPASYLARIIKEHHVLADARRGLDELRSHQT